MIPVFEGFCHESCKSYLFQEIHQMKNYELYRQLSTPFHVYDAYGGSINDYKTSTQLLKVRPGFD